MTVADPRHPSYSWRHHLRPSGGGPARRALFDERSRHPDYPKTSAYDPAWVFLNHMGPNVLWLTEWLTGAVGLEPGMRVLDLGCGAATSSIFLAREFGVQVWAADLWISPDDNWRRVAQTDVADRVLPISVEAHALPFPVGFFDAIVSVDSYHYYGTDVRYLAYLARYARAGAPVAIAVPSHPDDPDVMPDDVTGVRHAPLGGDYFSFRSAEWWRRHWEQSGVVDVEVADLHPTGWELWYRWCEVGAAWDGTDTAESGDAELLLTESGRALTFARAVARTR
jgi:SAM-dependent methyltransferase